MRWNYEETKIKSHATENGPRSVENLLKNSHKNV